MDMRLLYRAGLAAIASFILFFVAPGLAVQSLYHALMLSVILGFLNALVPYVVSTASYQRNFLNIALFLFGINTFALYLMTYFNLGLGSSSFSTTALAALTLSVLGLFITLVFGSKLNIK